jgi:hypothetical protein
MRLGKLYIKDKKWIIETDEGCNTFATKESAKLFANFYKIKLNEES